MLEVEVLSMLLDWVSCPCMSTCFSSTGWIIQWPLMALTSPLRWARLLPHGTCVCTGWTHEQWQGFEWLRFGKGPSTKPCGISAICLPWLLIDILCSCVLYRVSPEVLCEPRQQSQRDGLWARPGLWGGQQDGHFHHLHRGCLRGWGDRLLTSLQCHLEPPRVQLRYCLWLAETNQIFLWTPLICVS